ncbi:UPF0598 protein C8orf82 homolog isoform X1 [Suricata suricatta]|uniref:UPF0598 protein C8orf82 homolog isoform X1 n=1 Tax=Suricata suricatta TaxID=37032 RepID=UPI001155952F|nr:UPF0598 protein C8orf82 homolog isoform X1 [Suricata suricatta]
MWECWQGSQVYLPPASLHTVCTDAQGKWTLAPAQACPCLPTLGPTLSGFQLGLMGHGLPLCLQLFLDDSKMKNFITCFKDSQFLVTFFSRLRPNRSGRYEASFPFLSLCGKERNFLRCEDRPVVFTHLLASGPGTQRLSYCGGGEALAVPFEPARLLPLAANGRLYHPAPERAGGVGLVRSALAFELSACFEYPPGAPALPSHVRWQGRRLALTMDLAPLLLAASRP